MEAFWLLEKLLLDESKRLLNMMKILGRFVEGSERLVTTRREWGLMGDGTNDCRPKSFGSKHMIEVQLTWSLGHGDKRDLPSDHKTRGE